MYKKIFYTLIIWCSSFAYGQDENQIQPMEYCWEGTFNLSEIRELFLESFLKNYGELGLTEKDLATNDITQVLNDYWDEEFEAIRNKTIRWIVAKDQEEIIGYASFNIQDSEEKVLIQLLCVKPSRQHQGIGQQLLHFIPQIIDKPATLLLVTRRVNTSAIAFYKKLGFQESCTINQKANIDVKLCIQLEKSI